MSDDLKQAAARPLSFGQTVKAVAWSFVGLRRGAGYQQDVEQRFADLTQAIELDPENADAWRVRGLTHLARSQQLVREQKLDEAKREREQALDDFSRAWP